jgi:hypothetical protein
MGMVRWDSGREGRIAGVCRDGAGEEAEDDAMLGAVSGSSWGGNAGAMVFILPILSN